MINRSSAGTAAPESAVPEPAGRKIHQYMDGTQAAAKEALPS